MPHTPSVRKSSLPQNKFTFLKDIPCSACINYVKWKGRPAKNCTPEVASVQGFKAFPMQALRSTSWLANRSTKSDGVCIPSFFAFTLLELLTTIAIIFVLLSMLLSGVSRAKPQATKISCISNLRQVGMALTMYADEADDQYPPRAGTVNSSWLGRLKPYYLDTNILRCPVEPDLAARTYLFNAFNDWFKANLTAWQYMEYEAWNWKQGLPSSAIQNPSETAVFGEKRTGSGHLHLDLLQGGGNDLEEIDHRRHPNGANFAFADGSVRWLPDWSSVSPVNLWAVTDEWRHAPIAKP